MKKREMRIYPYDHAWKDKFVAEAKLLRKIFLSDIKVNIEHIGSTAVPGLSAKPTIDIMIGVESLNIADSYVKHIEKVGYEYVKDYEQSLPDRRFFRKGYCQAVSYHIHLVVVDSVFWKEHLLFRDILINNPSVKNEYFELKSKLSKQFIHDPYKYSQGKSKFIQIIIKTFGSLSNLINAV
jgi:GrpB-like predicted nucleotidyltransferase (UPF0157 family)